MLRFSDPIVGGTTLLRAAIRSPNYAAALAGWTINQDGSAEFNNVVIRGGESISGVALAYSAAPALGDLVASEAAVAGTDTPGNAYLGGVVSYVPSGGSYKTVQLFAGQLVFSQQSGGYGNGGGYATYGVISLVGTVTTFTPGAGSIAITGSAAHPVAVSTDTWEPVTVPAGMTGSIRVKLIAEVNMAVLDVNVTITSTNATGTTYTAGSLPSGSYYPAGLRKFPLATDTNLASAVSTPRVHIPASGAVLLLIPAYNAAGGTAVVSGTVTYPLD